MIIIPISCNYENDSFITPNYLKFMLSSIAVKATFNWGPYIFFAPSGRIVFKPFAKLSHRVGMKTPINITIRAWQYLRMGYIHFENHHFRKVILTYEI